MTDAKATFNYYIDIRSMKLSNFRSMFVCLFVLTLYKFFCMQRRISELLEEFINMDAGACAQYEAMAAKDMDRYRREVGQL